jgi:hypothetical protein
MPQVSRFVQSAVAALTQSASFTRKDRTIATALPNRLTNAQPVWTA